jgi:hypothetical protein
MPKDSRSADFSDGPGGRITKAAGSTNITPPINWNPDLTEKHGEDVDEYGGGELCYPKNGGGKDDPVG